MSKRRTYNLDKYSLPLKECIISEWISNREHREILKAAYIDGQSNESIAVSFDYSVGAVKNIIRDSYPILLEHLEMTKECFDQ